MVHLASVVIAVVALQAPPPSADWPALTGRWEGEGTFQGQPASGTITWEGVLAGRFERLAIALSLGNRVVFEGHAYYDLRPTEPIRGSWFDSQGASYPISATFGGDSLVALWGSNPAQPSGRSVYRVAGDRLVVSDYVSKAGEWRQFARLEYRRLQ
jgi:hypothetical protein